MLVPIEEDNQLFWDSTYALAVALMDQYPGRTPSQLGLHELAEMVIKLPGFIDDPALVTERILMDIQITWFEEVMSQ